MKLVNLFTFLFFLGLSLGKEKDIRPNTYEVDDVLVQLISENNLYSELDEFRLSNGLLEKELKFVKQLNRTLIDIESGRIAPKKAKRIVHIALQYYHIKQFNKEELKNLRQRLNKYVKYY